MMGHGAVGGVGLGWPRGRRVALGWGWCRLGEQGVVGFGEQAHPPADPGPADRAVHNLTCRRRRRITGSHRVERNRGAFDPVAHGRRGGQLVVGVAQRGEHPAGLAGRVGCGGTHLGGGLLGHAPSMGRQPAR